MKTAVYCARILPFIAVFCIPNQLRAEAGDVWVSPYSQTQHFGVKDYGNKDGYWGLNYWNEETRSKFQDSHPSLGVEYQYSASSSIAAGVYRDSYGTTSVYFSNHWRYAYGLGATMGVLVGPSYPNRFVPFLGPEISVQMQNLKVSLAYLPNFGVPNQPSIAVLQAAIKVW